MNSRNQVWRQCAAPNCTNSQGKAVENPKSFFRFPKDKNRCEIWKKNCDNPKLTEKSNEILYANHRLCADHFELPQFMNAKRDKLIWNAIPTLFITLSSVAVEENTCLAVSQENVTPIHKRKVMEDVGGEAMKKFHLDVDDLSTDSIQVTSTDRPTEKEKLAILKMIQEFNEMSNNTQRSEPNMPTLLKVYRFYVLHDETPEMEEEIPTNSSLSTLESSKLETSGSSRKTPLPDTPRRKLLKKKLRLKTNLISRYKKRVANLKHNETRSKMDKMKKILELSEEFLTSEQKLFFETQLKLSLVKRKGRRWKESDQKIALSLFYKSPTAYKLLRKLFCFPHPRTLRSWLAGIPVDTGINDFIFHALEQKVKKLKPTDRLCVLTVDEMSIHESLSYNNSSDKVEGLVDYGMAEREKVIANEALVIMVHGLCTPYKQPICYVTSRGTTNPEFLKKLIIDCVERLQNIGLTVKVIVSDQGAANRSVFKKLEVTIQKPFIVVNNQKVFCMYDCPHLLKSLRNNFQKYPLTYKGHKVNFRYVEDFYKQDSKRPIRLAPKLTSQHITPNRYTKMRVKNAAQVFSHSVAAGLSTYISFGLLHSHAVFTAEFIADINDVFDAVNSSKFKSSKPLLRPFKENSPHKEVLEKALKNFESLKFELPNNVRIYCVDGWMQSINCLLELWKDLQIEGLKFFFTRRLNQDPLENLFATIRQRGGNRSNPSAAQFRQAFKQVLMKTFLSSSANQNCETDVNDTMFSLKSLSGLNNLTPNPKPKPNYDVPVASTSKPRTIGLKYLEAENYVKDFGMNVDMNCLTYIVGSVIRKVKANHDCVCSKEICQFITESDTLENSSEIFIHLKAYSNDKGDFGGLTAPSDAVVQLMLQIEKVFLKKFNECLHLPNILQNITNATEEIENNDICEGFKKKLVRLYCQMRLFYALKFLNFEIVNEKNEKLKTAKSKKLLKLKHLGC